MGSSDIQTFTDFHFFFGMEIEFRSADTLLTLKMTLARMFAFVPISVVARCKGKEEMRDELARDDLRDVFTTLKSWK
jgi:hypothetical protein